MVFFHTLNKKCVDVEIKGVFCMLNEKMYGGKNKTSALLLIYDVGDLVL